jgi:excisionase family DNA binding protein
MADVETFVPIEELAKHFSVSVSTIRAWIRQGYIPKDSFLRIGSTYRFKISEVEASLIESKRRTIVSTKEDAISQKHADEDPLQMELDFAFNPDEDA